MLTETTDPYRLAHAIGWLAKQDMLDVRHKREHYVIRVRSTGRVYRTVGCPLDFPEHGKELQT